jgi:hypothetical protein
MILFLKIFMLTIAAIWGLLLGVSIPASMLAFAEIGDAIPAYIPVLWLVTSVIGFIVPCVLVRLKLFKVAAGLSIAGAVSLIVVHINFSGYITENMPFNGGFYLPLLLETAAIVTITVSNHNETARKHHNSPAPSILGKREKETAGYKMRSSEEYDISRKPAQSNKKRKRKS